MNKQAVALPGHRGTGLEIKQAAIAQGVEIEVAFQLVGEPAARRSSVTTTTSALTRTAAFVAVAGDDNS